MSAGGDTEHWPVAPRRLAVLRTFAVVASAVVILLPAFVLVGWALEITALKSVFPGLVAMNPTTAVSFILAGTGLAFSMVQANSGVTRVCGAAIGGIGATVLFGYFNGWNTGIDRLFFPRTLGTNVMAPTTALAFTLSGVALWALDRSDRRMRQPAQNCAVIVALMALLALIGYAYGVEQLYRVGRFIAMALHTASTFLVLALGILCARPERGPMRRIIAATPGGSMLRHMLPATVAVPFVLGWVILRALRTGSTDAPLGFTMFVLGVVIFVATTIWRNAISLDHKDAQRSRAESQLREAHAGLEAVVERRTKELTQAIGGIRDGLRVLAAAAQEILESSSQLAASANETATSVDETTATVDAVRQTTRLSADRVQRVADTAREASTISGAGRNAAEAAAASMRRISEEMGSIGERIVQLTEQSHAIGEIIATVDDLAEESNLLAVNAAIEAATAGEHGKGFAVVAEQVRYLANQSRQATHQVRAILGEIQRATGTAVLTTEQAARVVEVGVEESARAGGAIVALTDTVDTAADAASKIATTSQQQLLGMDQVALAMEQIRTATVQNVDEAQQLEAAARDLNALGQRLNALLELQQT